MILEEIFGPLLGANAVFVGKILLSTEKEIQDEEIVEIARTICPFCGVTENDLIDREPTEEEKENMDEDEQFAFHCQNCGNDYITLSLKLVRRALYVLNEYYIARYRRERDKDTGYFLYYWYLLKDRLREQIIQRREKIISLLQARYDFESENLFYACEDICIDYPFADAFEKGFICENCGKPLAQKANADIKVFLEKKIKKMQESLNAGVEEI
ncbi:MAG: hypothetical protein ACFFBD_20965 [Candidatus Hodarchaeota archaeon]